MENLLGKYVEVCVVGGKEYRYYHGVLKGVDGHFINLLDQIDGNIFISKDKILFIKEYRNVVAKIKESLKALSKNEEVGRK